MLVALLGCSYVEQQGVAAPAEVIVKFAPGQAINTTIAKALDDAGAEKSLGKSMQNLSAELGIPFEYSRLTSGREIVLEVPVDPVLNAIAERLRQSDAVATYAIASGGTILVAVDRSGIDPDLLLEPNKLGSRLIDDSRLPVHSEFRADGRLALTPDLERLVTTLVTNLGDRDEVEYAQPNYRARHYGETR